jgi:hypothetical protein
MSSCPSRHFFASCLFLAQNPPTTQYTQKSSESSLLTMAFSTPARTKHPNTCHNTSVPEDPSQPVLPPSSAPLRTRSERLIGASAIQQEESHHSPFIMASSLPTWPTHMKLVKGSQCVRQLGQPLFLTRCLHLRTDHSKPLS